MQAPDVNHDKSSWATGGGIMIGVGAGFLFFHPGVNPFGFVGCIIGGLGLGLMTSAILSAFRR